jgi:hypothetical protein
MSVPAPARNLVAVLLVVVTVVGTFLVAALPFGWILLLGKLNEMLAVPPMAGLAVLLVGMPASMVLGVRLLLRVSDLYERLRGNPGPAGRVAPVWRRGLTDTKRPSGLRMLDVVMVVSVVVALLALATFFVAGGGGSIRLS